ncbi:MAG: TetR/AcrR family transcriptional regulator [Renibacterium salmoninarum]|nr:TetR/AcrR family transcriptional regulator [Renibacterium salmoninarum]
MPKVTEAHREQMRKRIQDAALACFARKGFSATSMADIVAESELSAGAIYGYYRGKDELTADAARAMLQERIGAMLELAQGVEIPPPSEVVAGFLRSMPEVAKTGLALQVWGEAVQTDAIRSVAAAAVQELTGQMAEYLRQWFRRGRGMDDSAAEARARLLAPAVVGLCQGYIVRRSVAKDESAESYFAAVAALLEGL